MVGVNASGLVDESQARAARHGDAAVVEEARAHVDARVGDACAKTSRSARWCYELSMAYKD